MLRASDLTKEYPAGDRPVVAVGGVSLTVARGEFLAVCGRSGSGKSTLLALLGGLTSPDGGTVSIDGTDLDALSADARAEFRRRRVGVVFQFACLLPTLRAIDNVALPALLEGTDPGGDPYDRAAGLLALVGLGDRIEAYPAELSGGQQRRVALARAAINRPALLLADEPTADLDADNAAEALAFLLDLRRRHGTTLVVATHDGRLAGAADRSLRLEGGRAVGEEDPIPGSATTLSMRSVRPEWDGLAPADVVLRHTPTPRLGAGLRRLLLRCAAGLALATGAIAVADLAAARYEHHLAGRRREAHRLLEEAALRQLRADVEDLSPGTGRDYDLSIYLQNSDPDTPLFVTTPAVRAFIQVGREWIEVPLQAADAAGEAAVQLSGRQTFRFRFTPDVPRFTELIPGYMHVRFTNAMLVSRDRRAAGGLFERSDDYYVYLKPPGADDAAIRAKNKWATAPTWIPMPPH
jgi:putative ABC transport system ATP-binding protein/macrolide transport system ATP-binding/permease protein/lipoprotein-releasing system ATP-binding protein